MIGSGMGGMTSAAALAKMGREVLLLEQYKFLGGLTHSFSREGFSWDVGIHYLGCVAPGERERELIDWLSHTPMEFESMGAVYDTLHIADAPPLALSRPYEAQERDLKDRFPDEVDAIEAWTAALRAGRDTMYKLTSTRAMPDSIGHMLKWWNGRAIDKFPSGARGKDYEAFRQQAGDKMFAQFEAHFPALAELVVFRELSTPLATTAITGHHEGAFYGLDVTPERALSDALNARTPIEGLCLTGQDVVSPGVQGALWSGLFAAASVDPRIFKRLRG